VYLVEVWSPEAEGDSWLLDATFTVSRTSTAPSTDKVRLIVPDSYHPVTADGCLLLSGVTPKTELVLWLHKDGRKRFHSLPVQDGFFTDTLWLDRGPGTYRLVFGYPSDKPEMYWLDLELTVTNECQADLRWLAPSYEVQSDDPMVVKLALEVTQGCETDREKARAVYRWITRNVEYDTEKRELLREGEEVEYLDFGALSALRRRKGVCYDYANLYAALLRASGVRCRVISGDGITSSGSEGHAWNEFWDGQRWVPVDPTWGAGYVDRRGRFHAQPTNDYFDPRGFDDDHVDGEIVSDWYDDEDAAD